MTVSQLGGKPEKISELSALHLIRNSPFDPKMIEQMTGMPGWDTGYTSCRIIKSSRLYGFVSSFIQENYEDVQPQVTPGFNHHFEAYFSEASTVDEEKEKRIQIVLAKKIETQNRSRASDNSVGKEGEATGTSDHGQPLSEKELEEELKKLEALKEEEIEKEHKRGKFKHNHFIPGLGMYKFSWDNNDYFALHQHIRTMHPSFILFIKGRNKRCELQNLIDHIVETYREKPKKQLSATFSIYNFGRYGWDRSHEAYGRTIESVVLPKETKDSLLLDLDEFLSEDNRGWYLKHGIPYKRCYLFHGVPGSGKTSLIYVIAALHEMNVCYLSPANRDMTDEGLQKAVRNAPADSIIVLEDVDALFTANRKKKVTNALTFSGLLNALDGVGSGVGQIFILSTNYRDRLDSALIREGRVDKQIEFDWIKPPEMGSMFGIFYEDATVEEKDQFAKNLTRGLMHKTISAATLQHFFIAYRKRAKEEALRNVGTEIQGIINTKRKSNDRGGNSSIFS